MNDLPYMSNTQDSTYSNSAACAPARGFDKAGNVHSTLAFQNGSMGLKDGNPGSGIHTANPRYGKSRFFFVNYFHPVIRAWEILRLRKTLALYMIRDARERPMEDELNEYPNTRKLAPFFRCIESVYKDVKHRYSCTIESNTSLPLR